VRERTVLKFACLKKVKKKKKMKVGFSFKNGIVKGTADSTVPAISNLEFVSEVRFWTFFFLCLFVL
jgi:hypothetical protein